MLRIWQVLSLDQMTNVEHMIETSSSEHLQIPLLNPKPFKEWKNVHSSDIFEVNWSPKDISSNYLLSVSVDCLVVIWNLNFDKPV